MPAVLLAAVFAGFVGAGQPVPNRQVAITFDDLPGASATRIDAAYFQTFTTELLAAFARHKVPAIGFVNASKLEMAGAVDPARLALLKQWADAGLELGNHTYGHVDLHLVPLDAFTQDVIRGEPIIQKLMRDAGKRVRYFRHPYLHTGRDAATRSGLESFLAGRGYRVAPVTIDNYDYLFARAYDRAPDASTAQRIIDTYLDYMTRVVAYYEQQSIAIVGRELPQILLLHANALNGRTFDAFAHVLKDRGYAFITLDRALEDPAYQKRDAFYGTGGITWLHRWALTDGKRGGFFAGEPAVPAWIEQAGK